jgi:alpha-L-fucosidase 2
MQSSAPRSINIRVSLSTPHTTTAEYSNIHNRLGFKSHLDSNNLAIEAQVAVKTEGATGISLATSPQQIVLMGFDTVTLYYTFGTGWSANAFPEFANMDPHERLTGVLDKAVTGWYGDLVNKHLSDYGGLFSRFRLEFGVDQDDKGTSVGKNILTTDQLVVKNHRGTLPASEESYLETLLVQYSRYLLITSSRPGSLPLTGNGVWASNDKIASTLSYVCFSFVL